MSRADVAAEFAKPSSPGTYLDGTGTSKLVIDLGGGDVFEPPTQAAPLVPPPGHIDDNRGDKKPVGVGAGH